MPTKSILQTVVGVGSLSVLARAGKMVQDSLKKPSTIKTVKGFTDITIGTALLVPTAELVNKL